MKFINFLVLILLLIGAISSCKKTDTSVEENLESAGNTIQTNANAIQSNSRNLTVVYLIPNDLDTLPNYKKRFDGILSWIQKFYLQEMERNGYGPKTFGLIKDPATQLVQVSVIRSTQSKAKFNGTLGVTEVNNFYAANPTLKQSQHILILMPSFSGGPDPDNSNPFYGTGRYCFAMDYSGFNIANVGTDPFTKWLGGLGHELGHAFNAAHDKESVSEKTTLGTALMGGGNYTLGKTKTFISAADAAIFNNNEVFNNNTASYYGNITTTIPKIYASYSAAQNAIICSGKFTSTGNVAKVLYYNDPNVNNEGTGTNKDYNAVTWVSPIIGTDSFQVVMPVNELWEKANGIPYELKVKFVHTNGAITQHIYAYTFLNGVPVIEFSSRKELSKTGWSIAGFSSEETAADGKAADMIDNSPSTFWHSRWSSNAATYPHFVSIDLGSAKTVTGGLSLTQRDVGATRAIKDFELQTSNDGLTFQSVFFRQAASGSGTQYFAFSGARTFRFFKIIATSSWDGTQNAAIAELGLY